MSDHLHFIEHRHVAGMGIVARFICKGDRTSPCHQYPADAHNGDEARWTEADRPTFVPHDQCWIEPWMNEADCAELCCPDGEPVRNGAITTTFEDCIIWEYADEIGASS